MKEPRPCPWCRTIPDTSPINEQPAIRCINLSCAVNPCLIIPDATAAQLLAIWNSWGDTSGKPVKSRRKTGPVKESTQDGQKFAAWFRTLLPADVALAPGWELEWGYCYDLMIATDKRTKEEVVAVCKWARDDRKEGDWKGWASVFLSPLMLRQRKNGMMYFDIWKEQMKGRRSEKESPAPVRNVIEQYD